MNKFLHSRPLIFRMFGLTMGTVLVALLAITYFAYRNFETKMAPEIQRKLAVVGHSLENQIHRAVQYGIPLDSLRGMPEFLDPIVKSNPEIEYIIVTDAQGRPLHYHGPSAMSAAELLKQSANASDVAVSDKVPGYYNHGLEIAVSGERQGSLHLGVSRKYIAKQLNEIAGDVITVLFVALLLAHQMIIIQVALRINFPIQQLERLIELIHRGDFRNIVPFKPVDEISLLTRTMNHLIERVNQRWAELNRTARNMVRTIRDTDLVARTTRGVAKMKESFKFAEPSEIGTLWTSSLDDARAPLFLGVLAEEMSRSFLPLYIDTLYQPIPGMTREIVISLPISVFMVCIALSTPWAGGWVERLNARKVFLLGMIPAGIGFLGTAMARGIYDLILWRSLCAIGYAMQTMACQGYIAHTTGPQNRAHGMAVFVTTIMIAAIGGTAIGGVLSDRMGYRFTFLLSVFLIALSGVTALHFLKDDTGAAKKRIAPKLSFKMLLALARNMRFSLLILFSAIPAKIMLTGFLFYLVPLYLIKLGNLKSDIGRMMMAYFIIMVIASPLAARLTDRTGSRSVFVVVGGLMSGLGMLTVLVRQDALAVLIGIGLFGIGQALSTAPLIAMVLDVTEKECLSMGQTGVLGLFRVLERVGSVAGPFIVASMVLAFGHANAMLGTGLVMIGSTVMLMIGLAVGKYLPAGVCKEE